MAALFPKNEHLPLTDEHKRNVEVDVFAVKRPLDLRRRTGIYFLFQGEMLVYIGKAVCIYSRILTHIKEGKKEFDGYAFIEISERDLCSRELQLIKAFQPFYNIAHVKLPAREAKDLLEKARQEYVDRQKTKSEAWWTGHMQRITNKKGITQ